MYSFNLSEQLALQKLPNEAARLAIQRWMELTYDGTHPEWKCRPMQPPRASVAEDLINALENNQIDQISSLVQLVSARMLYVDKSARRWQHNTVKRFLLDPTGDYEKKLKLDLVGRLRTILGLSPIEAPDETKRVTLSWLIEPQLRAATQAPWKNQAWVSSKPNDRKLA